MISMKALFWTLAILLSFENMSESRVSSKGGARHHSSLSLGNHNWIAWSKNKIYADRQVCNQEEKITDKLIILPSHHKKAFGARYKYEF